MVFFHKYGNIEDSQDWFCGWKVKMLFAHSCLTLCDPVDCSPPGSPVHGIFQARILEWVAISFSRGTSQPRDWTRVSCIAVLWLVQHSQRRWWKKQPDLATGKTMTQPKFLYYLESRVCTWYKKKKKKIYMKRVDIKGLLLKRFLYAATFKWHFSRRLTKQTFPIISKL